MKTIGKTLMAMIIAMSFVASTLAANVSSSPTNIKHGSKLVNVALFSKTKTKTTKTTPASKPATKTHVKAKK